MSDTNGRRAEPIQQIDHPGPVIRAVLVNDDIEEYPAEELGEYLWRIINMTDAAILKLPQWWVNQEMDVWEDLIAVHIDYHTDGDEDSYGAYHIVAATQARQLVDKVDYMETKKEQGEIAEHEKIAHRALQRERRVDEKIRNWTESTIAKDKWVPKSLVEYGFRGEYMMPRDNVIIVYDEDNDTFESILGRQSRADMVFKDDMRKYIEVEGNSNPVQVHKIKLDFPYDEDMIQTVKELDWEDTHRTYDDEEQCWLIDLDAVRQAIIHLASNGYTVAIDNTDGRIFPDDDNFGLWFNLP